jgi:phosphate-selective porin OprO/OprP
MQFKFTKFATVLLASGIISLPLAAHANDSSELEELRALVQKLDQQVRVLARQGEISNEEAVAAKKTTPVVKASENGFGFESADGKNSIKLKGLLQIDNRNFSDVNGLGSDGKNISGFDFRRIRPTIEGTVFGKYDFRFTPEFGEAKTTSTTSTSGIVDAYIDARFQPSFKVRAGKFKPFVGLERLQSGSDIKFIERSYVSNNILPNRDLGAAIHGDVLDGKLNYSVGIYNGVVDGGDMQLHSKILTAYLLDWALDLLQPTVILRVHQRLVAYLHTKLRVRNLASLHIQPVQFLQTAREIESRHKPITTMVHLV